MPSPVVWRSLTCAMSNGRGHAGRDLVVRDAQPARLEGHRVDCREHAQRAQHAAHAAAELADALWRRRMNGTHGVSTMPTRPNKVVRVGLVSPPRTLNPREAFDLVSAFAVAQVFETAYVPPKGDGPTVPVLFDGPLTPVGAGDVYGRPCATRLALLRRHAAHCSDRRDVAPGGGRGDRSGVDRGARRARALPARGEEPALRSRADADALRRVAVAPGRTRSAPGPTCSRPTPTSTTCASSATHMRARQPRSTRSSSRSDPPDKDGSPSGLLRALGDGEVDFTTMLSRNDAASVKGMKKHFQSSNSTAMLYLEHRAARAPPTCACGVRSVTASIAWPSPRCRTPTRWPSPPRACSRPRWGNPVTRSRSIPARAQALLAEAGSPKTRLRLVVVWAPRPYLRTRARRRPHQEAALRARLRGRAGVTRHVRRVPRGRLWIAATTTCCSRAGSPTRPTRPTSSRSTSPPRACRPAGRPRSRRSIVVGCAAAPWTRRCNASAVSPRKTIATPSSGCAPSAARCCRCCTARRRGARVQAARHRGVERGSALVPHRPHRAVTAAITCAR